jgi:hypothetical protein
VIEARTLYFDIESAQRAFDALAPLAFGATSRELLVGAKQGNNGELHEATIPWLKPTQTTVADSGFMLLGYIHIRGKKLAVEVNSAQRARAFRLLISGIPAATARYRGIRKRSPDRRALSSSYETDLSVTQH